MTSLRREVPPGMFWHILFILDFSHINGLSAIMHILTDLFGKLLFGKLLFTWLSLVMSMMVSFVLSFFPRDVLDEILNLIESVFEDFPSYSCSAC